MRRPPMFLGVAALAVLTAVLIGVPAGEAGMRALAARSELTRAESHLGAGRHDQARASLATARRHALAAAAALERPGPSVVARLPVVGRSPRTAHGLAMAVAHASDGLGEAVELFPERSPWSAGAVDMQALERMRDPAARAEPRLAEALATAADTPGRLLIPPIGWIREDLIDLLTGAHRAAEGAGIALQILPATLGASEPRRYLILAQNATENRGTGGFWGNYGFLDAHGGALTLSEWGRPARDLVRDATFELTPEDVGSYQRFLPGVFWQNINMIPDFPSAAALVERHLAEVPDAGPIDGVIAVDAFGLAALLELTGSVDVEMWPEPLTADNVVDVVSLDAYREYADDRVHHEFFGDVAHAVWRKVVSTPVQVRPRRLEALGRAVRRRHVLIHLTRPHEQEVVRALGADGALVQGGAGAGDVPMIGLVTHNAAANKADVFLHRSIDATVRLLPDGDAELDVRVELDNRAPSSGEPSYVIGPNRDWLQAGENRQFVVVYLPPGSSVISGEVAGLPAGVEREMGLTALSGFVSIPSRTAVELTYRAILPDHWDPAAGSYELLIRRQPAQTPDQISIEVVPPRGWRIGSDHELAGLRARDGRFTGTVWEDAQVGTNGGVTLVGQVLRLVRQVG